MPIIGRVSKTRLLESARLKLTEYCTDLSAESLCTHNKISYKRYLLFLDLKRSLLWQFTFFAIVNIQPSVGLHNYYIR